MAVAERCSGRCRQLLKSGQSLLTACGGTYHELCFVCSSCGCQLSRTRHSDANAGSGLGLGSGASASASGSASASATAASSGLLPGYMQFESSPFCPSCYTALHGTKCAHCGRLIVGDAVVGPGGRVHPECWVCTVCSVPFGPAGRAYPLEGKPYCQTHYNELIERICVACECAITEASMVWTSAGKFHVRCFACSRCKAPLSEGAVFEDTKIGALCSDCSTARRNSVHMSAMTTVDASATSRAAKPVKKRAKKRVRKGKRIVPIASSAFPLASVLDPRLASLRDATQSAVTAAVACAEAVADGVADLVPRIRAAVDSSGGGDETDGGANGGDVSTLLADVVALVRAFKGGLDAMTAENGYDTAKVTAAVAHILAAAKAAHATEPGDAGARRLWDAYASRLETMAAVAKATVREFVLRAARALQIRVLDMCLKKDAAEAVTIAWVATRPAPAPGYPLPSLPESGWLARVASGDLAGATPAPVRRKTSMGPRAADTADPTAVVETVTHAPVKTLSFKPTKRASGPDAIEVQVCVEPPREPHSYREFAGLYRVPLSVLDEPDYARQEALFEVIASEAQFVADLEVLVRVYARPLRQHPEILDPDMTTSIFANLEDLIPLHRTLLASLQGRVMASPLVSSCADLFIPKVAAFDDVYGTYCSNHPRSIGNLTRSCRGRKGAKLRKFLEAAESLAVVNGQPLKSYLIKPVQRLCRYPLLFRELIKQTPASDPELLGIQQAYKLLDALVQRVNENKRVADIQRRVEATLDDIAGSDALELSANPVVVHDGPLVKVKESGKTEARRLVLMDNCLMWVKSRRGTPSYTLRNSLPLSDVIPEDIKESDPGGISNAFRIRSTGKDYVWQAESHQAKVEWLLNLNDARNRYLAQHSLGFQPGPSSRC